MSPNHMKQHTGVRGGRSKAPGAGVVVGVDHLLGQNHNFIQLLRLQTLFHAMAIIFLLV